MSKTVRQMSDAELSINHDLAHVAATAHAEGCVQILRDAKPGFDGLFHISAYSAVGRQTEQGHLLLLCLLRIETIEEEMHRRGLKPTPTRRKPPMFRPGRGM
jgi:hypothetical protein